MGGSTESTRPGKRFMIKLWKYPACFMGKSTISMVIFLGLMDYSWAYEWIDGYNGIMNGIIFPGKITQLFFRG